MLIISFVLALFLITGQQGQHDDARILGTGDIDARRDALARISAITPAERTPDQWNALRQEVDRLVACLDVRSPSPAERQTPDCDIKPRSEDE